MSTTWLDKVLAMPVIGVQLAPNFTLCSQFRQVAGPLLDKLVADGSANTYADIKDWGVRLTEKTGFQFEFKPRDLVVQFYYVQHQDSKPGKLPTAADLPLTPYSVLLQGCMDRIRTMTEASLKVVPAVTVVRIGVMARVFLAFDDLPPGVERMYSHFASHWPHKVVRTQATVSSTISESDGHTESCHHHLNVDLAAPEPELNLTLDWQRVFKPGIDLKPGAAHLGLVPSAVDAAVDYFEQVGEGVLWND